MEWTWLLRGVSKMPSFQCGKSALIRFLCCGPKLLGFSVRIEINKGFVLVHRNRLGIRVGSKLT